MNKPMKLIVDCSTGVTTEVEMTDEELEQQAVDRAFHEQMEAERKAEADAKAEAKASAIAKLAALGLTEEEAKAIAG